MGLVSGPNVGIISSQSTAVDRAKKDGCMIAVSTKFPRTQIRCVHHWMPGRIIGLRLQCGMVRNAGTCTSSVHSFFKYFTVFFSLLSPTRPHLQVCSWALLISCTSPLWVLWLLFVCSPPPVRSVPLLGVSRFVRSHRTGAAGNAPARFLRRHSFICLPCRFSLCLLLIVSLKSRRYRSLRLSLDRSLLRSFFAVPFRSVSILFRHSSVCACHAVPLGNDMHPRHRAVNPKSSQFFSSDVDFLANQDVLVSLPICPCTLSPSTRLLPGVSHRPSQDHPRSCVAEPPRSSPDCFVPIDLSLASF